MLLCALGCAAQDGARMYAKRLKHDEKLNTDPASRLWRKAPAIFFDHGPRNDLVPGYRTEVRALWSPDALYFLFTCPYETLHLRPSPDAVHETDQLWEHDVAEIFIGGDFEKFWQYREFEISPQNEWVDLDIDTRQPKPDHGWRWDSGFDHAARVDEAKHIWYAAFRIPAKCINGPAAAPGAQYRLNFYRAQGPQPNRKLICWRPTGSLNFHVPEAFGTLRLEN
jgi:hypothetical protein